MVVKSVGPLAVQLVVQLAVELVGLSADLTAALWAVQWAGQKAGLLEQTRASKLADLKVWQLAG